MARLHKGFKAAIQNVKIGRSKPSKPKIDVKGKRKKGKT
jgi:hypothetical protein